MRFQIEASFEVEIPGSDKVAGHRVDAITRQLFEELEGFVNGLAERVDESGGTGPTIGWEGLDPDGRRVSDLIADTPATDVEWPEDAETSPETS